MLSLQAPFASPSGKSYLLFDVRTNAEGAYTVIEPLYSDLPGRTRDAARFLRENLLLSSRAKGAQALQVYVGLTVDESGQIGYFIAGAGELL